MYLKIIEKQVAKKIITPDSVLKRERVIPLADHYESYHFTKGLYGGFDSDPKMPENCIGLIRYPTRVEGEFVCHYITSDQEAYIVDGSGKTIDQFSQSKIGELSRELYWNKEIDELVELWTSVPSTIVLKRIQDSPAIVEAEIINALKPLLAHLAHNELTFKK